MGSNLGSFKQFSTESVTQILVVINGHFYMHVSEFSEDYEEWIHQ